MGEKDIREILKQLEESNRQQVKYAKLQSALAIFAAICFIVLVFVIGSVVPKFTEFVSDAQNLLGQAEIVLTNLEDVTEELTEIEFTQMIENVDRLVISSQEGLENALDKINSIDIETLNEAIASLAKVVEPLAKFFKVFG